MREPAVQVLAVHLPFMNRVTFRDNQSLQSIIVDEMSKKSTLTQWMEINKVDTRAHELTYIDFPQKYVWNNNGKFWSYRVRGSSIGRLAYVHSNSQELFYLRLLLSHKKRCTSFDDIRTITSIVYPSYRLVCEALGLLGDDRE